MGKSPHFDAGDGGALSSVDAATEAFDDATAAHLVAVLTEARPIDGRYQLLEELGAGGMATVHRARDLKQQRDVAIKFMKSELGGTARRRFMREFSTISALNHPCCLGVYDIGESDDGPYFTMELHPGQSIEALIGQPAEVVAVALVDITLAVDFIHSQGIVHRDIKPSNILVSYVTNNGRQLPQAKLADFGLAKYYHLDSSLTNHRGLVGTPAYCAPEQIEGRRVDHRADLYAIGMLAYELLSGGVHPFAEARAEGVNSLLHAQLTAKPESLVHCNRAIPTSLAEVVASYLEKSPDSRPPSARPLREALCQAFGLTFDEQLERLTSVADVRISTFGFVCRQQELEQVESYLLDRRSHDGHPSGDASALIVVGEPGVGKTSLVQEGTRKALSLGYRVLGGRCFDGEAAAFHPFVTLLRQVFSGINSGEQGNVADNTVGTIAYGMSSDGPQLKSILSRYQEELLRIAPELRRWLGGKVRDREIPLDAQYIYRSLTELFLELSSVKPLCLYLDDLQWADHSSLSLLKHLAAAIKTHQLDSAKAKQQQRPRLAIICSAREGYPDMDDYLRREQATAQFGTISLTPFNREETQLIVSLRLGCVPGQVAATLVDSVDHICRGNPFFITETIREWQERGVVRQDGETWVRDADTQDDSSLPSTVRTALGARLSELSDTCREMLAAGAVIGRVVDIDLLAEVLPDTSEQALLDGLDVLLSKRILLETGSASRVEFAHDLMREIVLGELRDSRKRSLHRRVAETLEQWLQSTGKRSSPAVVAYHFISSDISAKALQYTLVAADESMHAYSFQDAVRQLQQVAKFVDPERDRRSAHEYYSLLTVSLSRLKQIEPALAAVKQMLELSDSDMERAEALYQEALLLQMSSRVKQALVHYDMALRLIKRPRPKSKPGQVASIVFKVTVRLLTPTFVNERRAKHLDQEELNLLIRIYCNANWISSHRFQIVECYYFLCSMYAVAPLVDNPAARGIAESKLGFVMAFSGVPGAGARSMKRIAKNVDYNAYPDIGGLFELSTGCCFYFAGRLDDAVDALKNASKFLNDTGDHSEGMAYHFLRHCWAVKGKAQLALETAAKEAALGEMTGEPLLTGFAKYGEAHALALMGQCREGRSAATDSINILHDLECNFEVAGYMERAFVEIQDGLYKQAVADLKLGTKIMWSRYAYNEVVAYCYPRLLEATVGPEWLKQVKEGKIAPDYTVFDWMLLAVSKRVFPNTAPHAWRGMGRYYFAKGKESKSRKCFEKAIAAADKIGSPYERARALEDSGRAFPDLAERRIEAKRILDELGCVLPAAERDDANVTS